MADRRTPSTTGRFDDLILDRIDALRVRSLEVLDPNGVRPFYLPARHRRHGRRTGVDPRPLALWLTVKNL